MTEKMKDYVFMDALKEELMTKRGNTETTARMTVSTLRALNDGKPFTSLVFLRDTDAILKKLDTYAETTRRTVLGKIVAVLEMKDSRSFTKLLAFYRSLFTDTRAAVDESLKSRGTSKTPKEVASWMTWEEILKRHDELAVQSNEIYKKKTPRTLAEYETLQSFMILSLYVLIPPRRNKDFHQMYVVRKTMPDDKTRNYFVYEERKFYFNTYKTYKTYDTQVIDVPVRLANIIWNFIKETSCWNRSRGRAVQMPLVCSYDGAPYEAINAMTRLLNKAMGKNVSCNLIRHAYVSHLYSDAIADIDKTAAAMAHSVTTHLSYYRKPAGGAGDSSSESSDSDSDVDVIKHV